MIVNKYNYGGGGSSSAVTPEEVQQQIDSALTPYWDSAVTESAITEAVSGLASEEYVQGALSGVDLTNYWTSAQTQSAITSASTALQNQLDVLDDVVSEALVDLNDKVNIISAATPTVDLSGYYTSAQTESAITQAVSGKADAASVSANTYRYFPKWNEQGIITGQFTNRVEEGIFNINSVSLRFYAGQSTLPSIYAPTAAGTSGQILTPSGNTPVWVTPATINGSAITAGGNIEIQAGGDMSAYMTSGDAQVIATALVDLDDRVKTISAATPTVDLSDYYTSAETETAITSKNYVTSAQVETQITGKNYASSADVTTLVNSAFSYTNEIERVTASAYTELHDDILALSGAGYVTSGQVETQITGKHYTTSSDQSVINIVKIEQTVYDTLVAQSATSQTTLYVVVPDSI